MKKDIDFAPINATETEKKTPGEAEMVDNCALIDRVAEEMLDKYEIAFLELAK